MHKRTIQNKLIKELSKKEILVLLGMRRVGKTTLLRFLFDTVKSNNKIFIDLEDILNRKIFEEINYENIWRSLQKLGINQDRKSYVFLDEIQYVRNLPSVVKYLYDHYNIKFVVTGSSSFYMKNLFSESLAGRKLVFVVYPLTFTEFLSFKNIKKEDIKGLKQKSQKKDVLESEKYNDLFDEYVNFGGFPQVVLEPNDTRKTELLRDILTSYFQKDVTSLSNFKEIENLRNLIILLTQRIGQKLDIVKLASSAKISKPTVYSYLEFLTDTYFISLIPKYSSVDRKISGNKKIYFCDTGIARILANISEGLLFENTIFNNLKQYYEIEYHQNTRGAEIDFLINQKIALEVKNSVSKADIANLKKRANAIQVKEYYVITRTFCDFPRVVMGWDL